jgi:subtilisin family serine protease
MTMGIWEVGGIPLPTHQQLTGKIYVGDGEASSSQHATHVGGTMVARGVDIRARGMAYDGSLKAYNTTSDETEMQTEASNGMLISNHSYGFITGWRYDGNDWYWYGDFTLSETEDASFGFYSTDSRDWDQIAHNNPYYLIFQSAGNDRQQGPSSQPQTHFEWRGGMWSSTITIRELDGGTDQYDCLNPGRKTSKNTIVIGATLDVNGGWSSADEVQMTSFSNWGPTDDGRIKPDISANGYQLYSSDDDADDDYESLNGTSMATPSASGSAGLLVEHYQNLNGSEKNILVGAWGEDHDENVNEATVDLPTPSAPPSVLNPTNTPIKAVNPPKTQDLTNPKTTSPLEKKPIIESKKV